jgi:Putative zinc- or iron-chelating domain
MSPPDSPRRRPRASRGPRWSQSPERTALLALYEEVDALVTGMSCACWQAGVGGAPEAQCCHFAVTGREPYPTAVELEEVRHAVRAANVAVTPPARPARQALAHLRPCPLLSPEGRCRIYASRPFGCRTFFCGQKLPREPVADIGRRIADLSARFAGNASKSGGQGEQVDPGPRPLTRALF